VQTTKLTLPSGLKAVIRPIGWWCRRKLADMRPAPVQELGNLIKKYPELSTMTFDELAEKEGADVAGRVREWAQRLAVIDHENQVLQVCACTLSPRLSAVPGPDYVDDVLDEVDFKALEAAILELHVDISMPLDFPRVATSS